MSRSFLLNTKSTKDTKGHERGTRNGVEPQISLISQMDLISGNGQDNPLIHVKELE